MLSGNVYEAKPSMISARFNELKVYILMYSERFRALFTYKLY